MALPINTQKYTYADYLTWPEDERWELIDGTPYPVAGPRRKHQQISMELSRQFANFFDDKPCEVYAAPFDVRLNAEDADDTVVQPDLFVICDSFKLRDSISCQGAPDFIIEITSPSTARMDRIQKYNKYLSAGVKEYWIIDTELDAIYLFVLKNGEYVSKVVAETDQIAPFLFPELVLDLRKVFTP